MNECIDGLKGADWMEGIVISNKNNNKNGCEEMKKTRKNLLTYKTIDIF